MIIDSQLEFSNAQAVTATAISTNVYDQRVTANLLRDIGAGDDLYIAITCQEAALAAGAATVTFSLESDDNAGLSSATVHFATAAIGKAALVVGMNPIYIKLPVGSYERFLGVRYTVGTGPLTAGKFTAQLVTDIQNARIYAKANG